MNPDTLITNQNDEFNTTETYNNLYQEDGSLECLAESTEELNFRAEKRTIMDDEDDDEGDVWTIVKGKEKKTKTLIEVYITSAEILPKQFAMAKLLKENNIIGIENVKYISPYKIRLDVLKENHAERIENCKVFIDKGWRIYKAMEKDISYGVIRNVDLDLSEDAILQSLSCQNNIEIVSVLRLRRRGSASESGWVPSECVRLGFRGSYLPSYVSIDGLKIKVDPYVFPVSQCSKCWRLGHMSKRCPYNKIVCPKCGGMHANCETTVFKCINCQGDHMALYKQCPVFIKEKKLRELMAEYNCTYKKALTVYVPPTTPDVVEPKTKFNLFRFSLKKNDSNTQNRLFDKTSKSNAKNKETRDTPTYAEILKVEADVHRMDDTINLPENNAVNKTKYSRAQRRRNVEGERSEFMGDNSLDSIETEKKQQSDNSVKFEELITKLKDIIFLKEISIQKKVYMSVKCCLEWLILLATEFISERSLFKLVYNWFVNNNG